jgi:hypothetical protein
MSTLHLTAFACCILPLNTIFIEIITHAKPVYNSSTHGVSSFYKCPGLQVEKRH